jgi:spore coat protein U-like protein
MPTRTPTAVAAALAIALAAAEARATTSCSFTTAVGVSFGAYDVFDASPLDSAGSLTYMCTGVGASDTIVIDLSRGASSSFLPRQMLQGSTPLLYNLYLAAARTTIWGDGTGGTSHYGPITPTSGSAVTVTVYGRVFARQNVEAGSYSDTVTATILF